MANIKNTNKKCWRGHGVKGTFILFWWEWKLVQPLWKTVWRFIKKLKIEVTYDPAISLLGIFPKECESGYKKGSAHPCLLQHYSQQLSYGKVIFIFSFHKSFQNKSKWDTVRMKNIYLDLLSRCNLNWFPWKELIT
jgi:hypothetical protein